mgnify:CR=1 FL=1
MSRALSEGGGESLPVRRPFRADAGGLRDGHHGKIHVSVLAIGVDIEQLSFEIQVIDLCHIARLSVRAVDRLLDARIIGKTARPQLRQFLSDIRDLERSRP